MKKNSGYEIGYAYTIKQRILQLLDKLFFFNYYFKIILYLCSN